MTLPAATRKRLSFLARVADKEARHLAYTDTRLFAQPFTPRQAEGLADALRSPGIAMPLTSFC